MTDDPWHYPRNDLAERTFNVLVSGPAEALTLFAPRRTGKTEFLRKDLAPYAQKKGHQVIYVSFWRAPLSPLALLLHSLESALKENSIMSRIGGAVSSFGPKLKLSAPLPGAKAEAEIDLSSLKGEPPAELILYLDDLFGRLENKKKPTLLLLDEIQELARDKENRSLVASLRTSLDTRDAGLKAIFTGSSREGLQAMFSEREAPFFHFGTSLDLEPLDESFVEHLLEVSKKSTGRSIERLKAISAFEQLHRSPYFFRGLIELLTLRADLSIEDGIAVLRRQMADKLGYAEVWLKLTAIQRATALQLALGAKKPFSKSTRVAIGKVLDTKQPSIDKVQTALRRLASLSVADRWSGEWLIEDPEFARWIVDTDKQN